MPGSFRKILVVEDSPTMCHLYRMALKRDSSTELVFAGDGLEALDRVAQEPDFDIMIVDINMPYMDGLEFLRRLRSDFPEINIPAVVISTEGGEEDRAAAFEAGAAAYLRKPWTAPQLLSTLEGVAPQGEPL